MKKTVFSIFLTLLFLTVPLSGKIPEPSGFLNDYAGVFTLQQKQGIENLLSEIEKKTDVEIAIAVIQSLEGRNLEEFSNELFNTWGVGKKNKDNGVLILVSMEDRKIRIEVGYGLESILTDGRCGLIIRNIIVPRFREKKYYDGILKAIEQINGLISGSPSDLDKQDFLLSREHLMFLIIWQLFCIWYAFDLARILGIAIVGSSAAVLDIIMLSGLKNPVIMDLALLIPFFLIFLLFFMVNKTFFKKYYGTKRRSHYSRFGSSSGLRSSGGGFGGGSSGGGGASGGW